MRALLVRVRRTGWRGARRREGGHSLHVLLRLRLHDRVRFVARLRWLRMFATRRGCERKLLMGRQLSLLLHRRLPSHRLGLRTERAIAGVAAGKCIARRHGRMCAVGRSCLLLRCPRLRVQLRHALLCGLQILHSLERCNRCECRRLHVRRMYSCRRWLHRMGHGCQRRSMRQRRRRRSVHRYRTARLQHLRIEMRRCQMRIVGRTMQLGGRGRRRTGSCPLSPCALAIAAGRAAARAAWKPIGQCRQRAQARMSRWTNGADPDSHTSANRYRYCGC